MEFFIPTKRKQPCGCFLLMDNRKARAKIVRFVWRQEFFLIFIFMKLPVSKNLAVFGYFNPEFCLKPRTVFSIVLDFFSCFRVRKVG